MDVDTYELRCTNRDQEQFDYSLRVVKCSIQDPAHPYGKPMEGWDCEVTFAARVTSVMPFRLLLKKRADGACQVHTIAANDLGAKGIPDKLLPFMAKLLEVRIWSGLGDGPDGTDFRSAAATKMWGRLVMNGLAVDDTKSSGRYYCP